MYDSNNKLCLYIDPGPAVVLARVAFEFYTAHATFNETSRAILGSRHFCLTRS